MRRSWRLLLTTILFLLAWTPAVFAFPPIPHYFSGTVLVDGNAVTDGTTISAWTGANQLVTTTTLKAPPGSGASYYAITIPGDDLDTAGIIEGAQPVAAIRFYIGPPYMTWAEQQGIWRTGEITHLNLTATTSSPESMHPRLYCPVIRRP